MTLSLLRTGAATLAALALLTACGRSASGPGAGLTGVPVANLLTVPTPTAAPMGTELARCEGFDFPPAAVAGPADAETGSDAVSQGLAAFLADPPPGMAMPSHGWVRLALQPTRALFAHRAADGSFDATVILGLSDGQWTRQSWGSGCTAARSVAGYELAPWHVRPGATVDATTTALPIVYVTGGCGAGTAAQRWDHAEIVESPSAVTITVFLRAAPFPTSSPGGPAVACTMPLVAVRRTITLPHPLGDRALLDGQAMPPRPVAH